jgi:hypothetical protein
VRDDAGGADLVTAKTGKGNLHVVIEIILNLKCRATSSVDASLGWEESSPPCKFLFSGMVYVCAFGVIRNCVV